MKNRVARLARPDARLLGDSPEAFLRALAGPSWMRIPGRDRARSRVLVTLLHGNEPSGVRALWRWLRSGETPAVDLDCGVISVDAAMHPPGFAERSLPGRADQNRCFLPGCPGHEGELAREVLGLVCERPREALVDLHNTTGHTPAYAVCTRVGPVQRSLAALFSDRLIHLDVRLGTLIEASAERVPGVVIECGRAGTDEADEIAFEGLREFVLRDDLALCGTPALRDDLPAAGGLRLYGSASRVRLSFGTRVVYAPRPEPGADLTLRSDLELGNFTEASEGELLGWVHPDAPWPLEVRAADGSDCSRHLFREVSGRLELAKPAVPVMVTSDARIATADCLFYLVHPLPDVDRGTSA